MTPLSQYDRAVPFGSAPTPRPWWARLLAALAALE